MLIIIFYTANFMQKYYLNRQAAHLSGKNSSRLFSIGCKMAFVPHILPFFYSVAQLCNAKKIKSVTKIPIFSLQSKKPGGVQL